MRRRLLVSYLLLTLFVLAVLEIPLGIIFARRQLGELTSQVERDAVVMATLVEDALEGGRGADTVAQVGRYARETKTRVVVVDPRGVAVADSSGSAAGTSFGNRPEITAALSGRIATGTRHSVTLGADLLYVAVPVASGGVVHGAVRITAPTSALDARVRRSWLTLAGVAAISLAGAAGLAVGLAGSVSRPLRRLEEAADAIGLGHLETRAPVDDGPLEVRALAGAFNDTAERLAGLLAAHDAFVADASHQLRSPLTALRLRLENLEAEVDGEALTDLRGAVAETRRLSRTVDGLLALARADRAAGEPPAGLVDPLALLEERRSAWSSLAEERSVVLAVEPADGSGLPPVRATADRLVQLVDNLLANALDAAPPGSRVMLRAQPVRAGGWVELHVIDEGAGLTDEERTRAFDRFWRGSAAPAAADGLGGSGLGLSIVRRLVAADGGEVELVAAPGGGTDAVVRLAGPERPGRVRQGDEG
jgi:signal transduction histidine kinase